MWQGLRVFCGICPDPECKTKLYFPSYAASSIECTGCGQHHAKESLQEVRDVEEPDVAMRNLLRTALLAQTQVARKGSELVKVKGYSNYHCKLLSPLFTVYGMDKHSGQAKLLKEMGQAETFDCSVLGDRVFHLEQEYLETTGYGRDRTGSEKYLQDTLKAIQAVNDGEERIVPLHVDGDGHCLVHALSRALVGREIFWHALRANMKFHLEANLPKYKELFKDFIDDNEWKNIIVESDPNYRPLLEEESMGLSNIHIFVLANVLHRPIVLLDSLAGMQSSADYSGLFLPILVPVHDCVSKDGHKHKPLAIAWNSSGHNHYVPLVAIKGKPVPRLPQWLIPKAWGVPNECMNKYIDLDSNGNFCIGGDRCIQDKYLQRLIKAMDEMFFKEQNISASLVTEVHQFVYKSSGLVGILPVTVTDSAKVAVKEGRLKRCLSCNVLIEQNPDVQMVHLCPGGVLYMAACASQVDGKLKEGRTYTFPNQQRLSCIYDAEKDVLVPVKQKDYELLVCHVCKGSLRQVKADNTLLYKNGDRTSTPVTAPSKCGCGFKHFWDGKEYDNLPERFPITLEWGGQTFQENVYWFQNESDPSLNSNVYDVASNLVQKHFPGEFGSERLVQKVVNLILKYTARSEGENRGAMPDVPGIMPASADSDPLRPGGLSAACFQASKSIFTGEKHKTFHREELTLSEAERAVKARTEQNAAIMQKRRTTLEAKRNSEKNKMTEQQGKISSAHNSSPPSLHTTKAQRSSPDEKIIRKDKKIRLSTVDGKQVMLTLGIDTTFSQLQESIERELGIPAGQQKVRHGFPPKELHPPESGKENEPVPLEHGEKVVVEKLSLPKYVPLQDVNMEGDVSEEGVLPSPRMAWTDSGDVAKVSSPAEQQQGNDQNAQLAAALVSALAGTLAGGDMLTAHQKTPEVFEKGGKYYNKVQRDLGPLVPDQHCTIPFFPGRVFAYNAEKDRLELCLGQTHMPILPGLNIPKVGESTPPQASLGQMGLLDNHVPGLSVFSEHSFSGAIMHRDSSQGRVAFSGQGRSLVSPSTNAVSGQVPSHNLQTSEGKSALTKPPAVQAQPDAKEGNELEAESKEIKTTITDLENSNTKAKNTLQMEVLDIEMKSPENDFPKSSVDPEADAPSAAVMENEQIDTEGNHDIDTEKGAIKECPSVCEEEKMDTETSIPEGTAAQMSDANPENVFSIKNNQVNTEELALFRDHEITSSKQNEDSTSLSSDHKENAAETQQGQFKEAINKENEISSTDDSGTAVAIDLEDV